MRFFSLLIFIYCFENIFAADLAANTPESICRLSDQGVVSRTALHSYPSYFFGVFADKNWVSFRGEDSNWVVDLDTAKKFVVPGEEDPVPIPGTGIITIPRPMRFFKLEDYSRGKASDALLVDSDLKGVYQSIGNLPRLGSSDSNQYIRVLTDDNKVTYRDYKVFDGKGGPQIMPLNNPVQICKGLDLKTPKLSKDGSFLAATDEGNPPSRTKIFSINRDGSCSVLKDLGQKTGKVDFSPDGKSIVFHLGTSMGQRGSFRLRPSAGDRLNIFEMRLSDKSIRQITFNSENKNSYYPLYRSDGKIIYLDQTIKAGGQEAFDFVVANPNLTHFSESNGFSFSNCFSWSPIRLLSQSWVDICGKPEKNSSDVEIKIAALDTRQCQLLANKTWKSMTTIQKLLTSENQLMAICPQNKTNSQPDRIGDSSSFNKPKSVLEVYSRRCAICHGDAFAIHDQAKLKETPSSVPERSQYDEIVRRIKTSNVNERMPKGMDLDEAERQILLSAFL